MDDFQVFERSALDLGPVSMRGGRGYKVFISYSETAKIQKHAALDFEAQSSSCKRMFSSICIEINYSQISLMPKGEWS